MENAIVTHVNEDGDMLVPFLLFGSVLFCFVLFATGQSEGLHFCLIVVLGMK